MVLTVFVALGRIAGAAKEIVVAYRYGTSEALDVYTLAFVLVTWAPVIALSLLQSSLVPALTRLDDAENRRFCKELTGLIAIVGLVASLVLWVAFPYLTSLFDLSFAGTAIDEFNWALTALTPIIGLMCLNAVFSMRLLAHEHHSNTLLEAVPAMVLLSFVLLYPMKEPNLMPLVYGTVIGVFTHLVVLILVTRRVGLTIGVSFQFVHEQWKPFRQAIGTLLLGAVAMSLVLPIDQLMAAQLDTGSVSTLSYATRLLTLAMGLAITVLTRALLPVLSDGNLDDSARTLLAQRWMLMLFAGGLLLVGVGWFVTPAAVSILFERGEFTSIDSENVSRAVRLGLFQVPILFVGTVLVQLFTSMQRYKVIVGSSLVALSAKLSTGIPLANAYGLDGIMISTVLMYGCTSIYFMYFFSRLRKNK